MDLAISATCFSEQLYTYISTGNCHSLCIPYASSVAIILPVNNKRRISYGYGYGLFFIAPNINYSADQSITTYK